MANQKTPRTYLLSTDGKDKKIVEVYLEAGLEKLSYFSWPLLGFLIKAQSIQTDQFSSPPDFLLRVI